MQLSVWWPPLPGGGIIAFFVTIRSKCRFTAITLKIKVCNNYVEIDDDYDHNCAYEWDDDDKLPLAQTKIDPRPPLPLVTCLNYDDNDDDDDYHDNDDYDDDHDDYDHDNDDDVDDGVCFYILLARSNFGGSASLANVHPALFCCQIDSMLWLSPSKVTNKNITSKNEKREKT